MLPERAELRWVGEPMGARVRLQRRRIGLTQDEAAAQAGMSKPYLSLIETGRVANPPSDEKLARLEQVLQLPAGDLVGEAQLHRTPPLVRAALEELLRAAEPTGQRQANSLSAIARRLMPDGDATMTPIVPVVSATEGLRSTSGFVACPGLTDPAAFAAAVAGDAMAPRFNDGDIVIFAPAVDVRSGDDCFVRLADGRTTFRRVFRETTDGVAAGYRLQPRNERYRSLTLPVTDVTHISRAMFRYERLDQDPANSAAS